MQERHNSIANALELRFSCTNPSIWSRCAHIPESHIPPTSCQMETVWASHCHHGTQRHTVAPPGGYGWEAVEWRQPCWVLRSPWHPWVSWSDEGPHLPYWNTHQRYMSTETHTRGTCLLKHTPEVYVYWNTHQRYMSTETHIRGIYLLKHTPEVHVYWNTHQRYMFTETHTRGICLLKYTPEVYV